MENSQEELFKEILLLKHNISRIASFVQNDFKKMSENEKLTLTLSDIEDVIIEMEMEYNELFMKLNNCKRASKEIMLKYVKV